MATGADWDSGFSEDGSAEQGFSFDTSGYSASDLGSSTVAKEGWYHFEVADVVPELETVSKKGSQKSPAVRFDLNVLHTAPGQSPAGATHFHRVYVGGKGGAAAEEGAIKMGLRFLLGLYGQVEGAEKMSVVDEVDINGKPTLVDAETGKPTIDLSTFRRAKGRQLIARIVYQPPNHEKGFSEKWEIPFGRTFRPIDPDVADVAKDPEALAIVGIDPAKCGKPPGRSPAGKSAAKASANLATAGPDLSDL